MIIRRRPFLDPEVERILREVASQPGSILLRASYTAFDGPEFERAYAHPRRRRISPEDAAGALEKLERADLAHGLMDEFVTLVRADSELCVLLSVHVARRAGVERHERAAAITRELLRCAPCCLLDVLARLATLAHRLAPSSRTRLFVAAAAIAVGRPQTALRATRDILASTGPLAPKARRLRRLAVALMDHPQ